MIKAKGCGLIFARAVADEVFTKCPGTMSIAGIAV
jgi:hypothetical protein